MTESINIAKLLVTVICTVYNHENFLVEALDSVKNQSYSNIELFIIDNGSKDSSKIKIEKWVKANLDLHPQILIRDHPINYCASFNEALFQSTGEFIIDLSGDDILLQGHIESSLAALGKYPNAGACFSDAELAIDNHIQRFYEVNKFGPPVQSVGDVYLDVIATYCVSTVTLTIRASLLKKMGGYDERLVYEDFDLLCRLARNYPFCYSPHVGVRKLIIKSSFSASQYNTRNSSMLESTLLICRKILQMNRREDENKALYKRVMFEAFHALGSANFKVAKGFLDLASEIYPRSMKVFAFRLWQSSALDISSIYQKLR